MCFLPRFLSFDCDHFRITLMFNIPSYAVCLFLILFTPFTIFTKPNCAWTSLPKVDYQYFFILAVLCTHYFHHTKYDSLLSYLHVHLSMLISTFNVKTFILGLPIAYNNTLNLGPKPFCIYLYGGSSRVNTDAIYTSMFHILVYTVYGAIASDPGFYN